MLMHKVKSIGRRFGVEMNRYSPVCDQYDTLVFLAGRHGAGTMLDVGANIGQFGARMIRAGWSGPILSFEPLADAHAALVAEAACHARWEVAPPMAIGAAPGTVEINVSGNLLSSSILPMLARHSDAAPESAYVRTETVKVQPLAAAIAARPRDERYFLKIDVQGFEAEVLRGAAPILPRCPLLHIEMSLTPLYEGESLLCGLVGDLAALGYRCVGLHPGFHDPDSREMLQADGIFLRD